MEPSPEQQAKVNSRPSVLITTYSASKCSLGDPQNPQLNCIDNEHRRHQQATRFESSTEFFLNLRKQLAPQSSSSSSDSSSLSPVAGLSQIKGPTGSVRGHKDVVRKSLEGIRAAHECGRSMTRLNLSTFMAISSAASQHRRHQLTASLSNYNPKSIQIDEHSYYSEYLRSLVENEQNQCVVYTTTLGVIRRTFEDSKQMKSILELNLIKFEERDIYLNQEYKHQLRLRCDNQIVVPSMFVDGLLLGGAKELERLNEDGQLKYLLSRFKMSKNTRHICKCCGNARFIACQVCNGSRKSAIHHFKYNSISLRCIKCDQNGGLVPCPICISAPEIDSVESEKDDPNINKISSAGNNTFSIIRSDNNNNNNNNNSERETKTNNKNINCDQAGGQRDHQSTATFGESRVGVAKGEAELSPAGKLDSACEQPPSFYPEAVAKDENNNLSQCLSQKL